MRIVIIDDSGLRATVLEEGLRDAGYDDIHIVPPRGAFVARLERMAPDVVLMDLGSPSRDTVSPASASAQRRADMPLVSCSGAPVMPPPAMLRKARTRVTELSMMVFLKSSKSCQPALPVSTTVVVPVLR